jgi:hypothetical protein
VQAFLEDGRANPESISWYLAKHKKLVETAKAAVAKRQRIRAAIGAPSAYKK